MRLRIDLAYDGTRFHGWAVQPELRTVQGELEQALGTVLRHPATVTCAGRTDTGVHARGQVVHVDVDGSPPAEELGRRLNGILPDDVRVRRVIAAPEGFDARFAAQWRRYVYRIADQTGAVDPLTRGHVLSHPRPLDLEAMNEAGASLVGEHDFAAFCRRREGATTVRELLELVGRRDEHGVIGLTVRADAFCHSMVRALMGCLVAVGEGRFPPSWAVEVLRAGVRDPRVTVMPAHPLTLEEVRYPPDDELASRARLTRAVREVAPRG